MKWVVDSTNRGSLVQPFEFALTFYGEKEISGEKDNPKVIQMFNDLGYDGESLKDETSWCAAFANWILMQQGYLYTGKLNARSFLDLPGETDEPRLGDIVVFWREAKDSWKGHVGFFISQLNGVIYTLGGNQSNMVNISAYNEDRLLGFRRPQQVNI